jgi:hypothetical protein
MRMIRRNRREEKEKRRGEEEKRRRRREEERKGNPSESTLRKRESGRHLAMLYFKERGICNGIAVLKLENEGSGIIVNFYQMPQRSRGTTHISTNYTTSSSTPG